MVGKPNIPSDFESLAFLRGEAMPTPGLNALDQEREASMADEGGASGAHIEVQEIDIVIDEEPIPLIQRRVEPRSVGAVALSGLLLGGVALLLVGGALRLRG